MDLRMFYRQLKEAEAAIAEDPAIVISMATSNGGKAGIATEVCRTVAAKLIVQGQARLATAEEASEHRKNVEQARQQYEQEANARRMQITVISDADLRSLREKAGKTNRG